MRRKALLAGLWGVAVGFTGLWVGSYVRPTVFHVIVSDRLVAGLNVGRGRIKVGTLRFDFPVALSYRVEAMLIDPKAIDKDAVGMDLAWLQRTCEEADIPVLAGDESELVVTIVESVQELCAQAETSTSNNDEADKALDWQKLRSVPPLRYGLKDWDWELQKKYDAHSGPIARVISRAHPPSLLKYSKSPLRSSWLTLGFWPLAPVAYGPVLVWFWRGPVRRERHRRKGLCLTCGYNLTGNTSGVCPECGAGVSEGAG